MKTTILFSSKPYFYAFFGILSIVIASCSSYQNSSYYDSDGIYGISEVKNNLEITQNNTNFKYKEYFNSLQSENLSSGLFNSVPNDSTPNRNQEYSNPNTTIIYVNDNGWNNSWNWNSWYGPNWGWNNWGWNNWYGSNWGWGWNNWYGGGWVQPAYYCGNPNYTNAYYSYNQSRRGSASRNNGISRNYFQNNAVSTRNSNSRTNDFNNTVNRRVPVLTNRNETRTQSNSTNSANSNYTRTQNNYNTTRTNPSENNSPTRSFDSNSNSTRSSSSFGDTSGRSYNGGGRSSGGGGRR